MKKMMDHVVGEVVVIELITWACVTEFGYESAIGRLNKGDVVTLVQEPSHSSRWTRKEGERPFGRWRALTKHGLAFIDIGSEGAK